MRSTDGLTGRVGLLWGAPGLTTALAGPLEARGAHVHFSPDGPHVGAIDFAVVAVAGPAVAQRADAFAHDDPARWDGLLSATLLTSLDAIHAVLGTMLDADHGDIVLVGGTDAVPADDVSPMDYACAWALRGLGHALRSELIGTGVRATTVLPGHAAANDVAQAVVFALERAPGVRLTELALA